MSAVLPVTHDECAGVIILVFMLDGGGAKPQRNEPSADAPARDLFAQFMKGNSMQLKIPKLKASVPSSGRA